MGCCSQVSAELLGHPKRAGQPFDLPLVPDALLHQGLILFGKRFVLPGETAKYVDSVIQS